MEKIRVFALVFLSLFFLVTVASAQVSPQIKPVATEAINTPNLSVQSVIPYDNGIVVVLSYVNSSYTNIQKPSTVIIYIYFFNSTTHLLLYEANLSDISFSPVYVSATHFFKNGELHIAINIYSFFAGSTYVYVFKGLKLVNTYTSTGMLISYEDRLPPYYNLSFPQINYWGTISSFFILLNNTSIGFPDRIPFVELQLPQGILVASQYLFIPSNSRLVPLNITMFNYNGEILWTENVMLCDVDFSYPFLIEITPNLYTFLEQTHSTVEGDQLFIYNITTPLSSPITSHPVNVTILGIDLSNGNITTRIPLYNVPPKTDILLLNIGGKLYVALLGNKSITIQMYNGTGFIPVAKIPLIKKVITLRVPAQTQNVTLNETLILNEFFYDYGNYLLVLTPTQNGVNATDIYYGGVANYTLPENVSGYELTPDINVLLLNESNNFSLAFLNSNGTVRATVSMGHTSTNSSLSISVAEINPYTYYVVKAYHNASATNATLVQVYEINITKHSANTSTTITTASSTTTSSHISSLSSVLIVGIVVAIVIIVVSFIVSRRR